ncbi:hypothetical protein ACX3O0_00830 [Homoserinimonas sp. A447]
MSDEQDWKPPVFTETPGSPEGAFVPPVAPTPASSSPYGPPAAQPAAPTYAQPQPAQPVYGQAPAAGWTAPPKPGLIPLRPLTLGVILGASFQVLRRNPRPTFGFALAIQSAIMLLTLVITGLVTFAALSRVVTASTTDVDEVGAGALAIIGLSTLIPGVLSLVAAALVQGILMLEIQRATLGEKLKLKQLWARARGRLGALVGWMFLLTAALLVAIAVLVLLIVLLAALGTVGVALAVVVGIFGGGALLAAAVWIGTKVSLVPSVLMGERPGLRDAIARSWSLVGGYFWRTFGIQLLVATILSVAMQVVTVPIQLLAPMAVFLIDPNGTMGPVTVIILGALYLLSILVILVLSSIVLVVQSAATGLIYIDLRMRKEGLDLDLARFVEERSAGQNPADPYLMGHPAASPSSQPIPPQSDSPWT